MSILGLELLKGGGVTVRDILEECDTANYKISAAKLYSDVDEFVYIGDEIWNIPIEIMERRVKDFRISAMDDERMAVIRI